MIVHADTCSPYVFLWLMVDGDTCSLYVFLWLMTWFILTLGAGACSCDWWFLLTLVAGAYSCDWWWFMLTLAASTYCCDWWWCFMPTIADCTYSCNGWRWFMLTPLGGTRLVIDDGACWNLQPVSIVCWSSCDVLQKVTRLMFAVSLIWMYSASVVVSASTAHHKAVLEHCHSTAASVIFDHHLLYLLCCVCVFVCFHCVSLYLPMFCLCCCCVCVCMCLHVVSSL